MNVYSIRLIPSLKLKFCEFLGIASTYAIEQLTERLGSLERKMEQLDVKARRNGGSLPAASLKVLAKPKARKKPKKKAVKVPEAPQLEIMSVPEAAPVPAAKRKTTRRVPAAAAESSVPPQLVYPSASEEEQPVLPAVILIRQDEATAQVVHDYFGQDVEILHMDRFQGLEDLLEGRTVVAVFFDRTMMGNESDREALRLLSGAFPQTSIVGLSSYLTLAITEAVPPQDEGFTFLTKPLTEKSLVEILSGRNEAAIS